MPRNGQGKITLYVDVVSPFAYEGFWVLRNDPVFKQWGGEIEYIPILLGGVMKACGNTPPINIRNKDKWINNERLRWASSFSIPMNPALPEGFPVNSLHSMRALCVIWQSEGQTPFIKCLEALWEAFWADGKKIGEKDVWVGILESVLGKEKTRDVVERAGKEGKELLAKNTERALGDGAFGLPWFVVENGKGEKEGFWGVDHLGQVVQFLGLEFGGDGGGKEKSEGWKSVL